MSAVARRASPYSTRFKLVAALVVAVAVSLLAFAYVKLSDDSDDPAADRDYIEALIPPGQSQILQQETVGVDLAPGWEGRLRLGNEEIPEDQLLINTSLNRVEFTPGPAKVVEAWPAGRTCINAVMWQSSQGRENGERTISWCFEVL